jgi:hypothetical protein
VKCASDHHGTTASAPLGHSAREQRASPEPGDRDAFSPEVNNITEDPNPAEPQACVRDNRGESVTIPGNNSGYMVKFIFLWAWRNEIWESETILSRPKPAKRYLLHVWTGTGSTLCVNLGLYHCVSYMC